jgi:hypothetical protein
MSLLRSTRLYASDNSEGCGNNDTLLATPAGDRHPGRMGHGAMDGAGEPENYKSHDDLA